MKNIYLIIALSATAFSMPAQLVLTRAGYDHIIGELELSQGWDSIAPIPRNTGQNQTWDFSAINGAGAVDTTAFIAPASVASSSLFPLANIVAKYQGSKYDFYKSGGTELEYLGNEYLGIALNYTDTQIQMVWPVAYGYSNPDAYWGLMTGGATGTNSGTFNGSATGTGTVIMPGGQVYTNVLQVNIYSVEARANNTNTFTFINNTNYYYRAGEKSPFLAAGDYTVVDSPTSIQIISGISTYTTVAPQTTTGLKNNNQDASFHLFPNPAKNIVTVALDNTGCETCKLQVYNALGILLKETYLGKEAGINVDIPVFELPAGIYFLKTTHGNKSVVKKLMVE